MNRFWISSSDGEFLINVLIVGSLFTGLNILSLRMFSISLNVKVLFFIQYDNGVTVVRYQYGYDFCQQVLVFEVVTEKIVEMLEKVVVCGREIRRVWRVTQNLLAQFI